MDGINRKHFGRQQSSQIRLAADLSVVVGGVGSICIRSHTAIDKLKGRGRGLRRGAEVPVDCGR